MAAPARCPECTWCREAPSAVPEKVFTVLTELEGHLAGEHDWTWQRAHEHACEWSKRLLPGVDLGVAIAAPGPRATRTARCPECEWKLRAQTEDLFEISHCSAELEHHLRTTHKVTEEEALAVAESWALPLLRNRVR